jgi:hypothetical protein
MAIRKDYLVPVKRDVKILELGLAHQKYRNFTAPEQFQRPEAWKAKDRKAFFTSILMNRVEGTYVLVDIQQCMCKLEKKIIFDLNTYNLFKSLLNEGFDYIVLDGNNRFCFISSLLSDEYSIPPGEYEFISDTDNCSVSTFIVKRGDDKFSDLPKRVQKCIIERQCVTSEYTQICLRGMSEVFANVNSGVPLNGQELRNAYCTEWADYVRKIRYEISSLLAKMFKDYKLRLKGDEWIVNCLDFVLNAVQVDDETNEVTCSAINQTTMNKLYRSTFLSEEEQSSVVNSFVELMDFVSKMIDEKVLEEKCLARNSAVQNLFWMLQNGLETYDQVVEATLLHEKAYQNKVDTYGDDEKTFKICCDGLGKDNIEFRYEILSEIVEKITENSVVSVT